MIESNVDIFIRDKAQLVRGMSSSFSMSVSARMIQIQADAGFYGDLLEIGVFEARFFIVLLLSKRAHENAIGVDTFDWPSEAVLEAARRNIEIHGQGAHYKLIKSRSGDVDMSAFQEPEMGFRFIHIDGDHAPDSFDADLNLASSVSAPWAIICLDDMFSPAYPRLTARLISFLDTNPEWKMLCVIDRQSLVGAPKVMICRAPYYELFSRSLADAFSPCVWTMGADMGGYRSLVLSTAPQIEKF